MAAPAISRYEPSALPAYKTGFLSELTLGWAGSQVNLRLFDPERRTTLLFVIRDQSKTPLKNLAAVLEKDLQVRAQTSPLPLLDMTTGYALVCIQPI